MPEPPYKVKAACPAETGIACRPHPAPERYPANGVHGAWQDPARRRRARSKPVTPRRRAAMVMSAQQTKSVYHPA